MFQPGQHVICVAAGPCGECGINIGLVHGRIYTVAAVLNEVGIDLIELPVKPPHLSGYHIERFRHLDDSRLSIFREALHTTDKPVEVDA